MPELNLIRGLGPDARPRRNDLFPFLAVAAIYLFCLLALPADGFWINDNGAKLIQAEGLVRSGWRDYSISWPGQKLDPEFRFNPIPAPTGLVKAGRLYLTYSEFFALASSVALRLFGFRGLCLLPLAGGLFTLAAVRILARATGNGPRVGNLALLIAGLATPLWFYSVNLWEHTPAVAFGLWSLAFMVPALRRGGAWRLVGAGLLAAGSCYFRAEMLLWAAALAGAWFLERRSWRGLVWFGAALGLGLLPLLLFQKAALGSPLGLHLSAHSPFAAGWMTFLRERTDVGWVLLLRSHPNRGLSLIAAAPAVILLVLYPRLSRPRLHLAVLGLAGWGVLSGSIVLLGQLLSRQPMRNLIEASSLFAVSPLLILALVRVKTENRASPASPLPEPTPGPGFLRRVEVGFIMLYLLLSPPTSQGIHWGGRFLLILYPLLSLQAAATLADWSAPASPLSRPAAWLLGLLFAISILAQTYSLYLLRERAGFSSRLNQAVAGRPEPVIIATDWFIPQELAPNFYDRPIFLIPNPQALVPLLRKLTQAGIAQALVVSPSKEPKISPGESLVVSDGLNFMSLRLQSLSFSGM